MFNYTKILLYIIHIINFLVTIKELQNAILSNNLINLSKKSNSNFKIN